MKELPGQGTATSIGGGFSSTLATPHIVSEFFDMFGQCRYRWLGARPTSLEWWGATLCESLASQGT